MEKTFKTIELNYYQYNIDLMGIDKPRPIELVASLVDVPNTKALIFEILENGENIHYEKIIFPKSITKYVKQLNNYDLLINETKPYKKYKTSFNGAIQVINYYAKSIAILEKLGN